MIELIKIQEFVENKNIILVGNNDNINKTDNSKIIDSYDIVVRMNHAMPEKNIGYKTDIWLMSFNNLMKQIKEYMIFKPKYTIRLNYFNEDANIHPAIKSNNLYIWPVEEHKKIEEIIGNRTVSTGCMGIYFFANYCKPKSISIIGYDFFKTKSFYNSINMSSQWHTADNERMFAEKYINNNIINVIK